MHYKGLVIKPQILKLIGQRSNGQEQGIFRETLTQSENLKSYEKQLISKYIQLIQILKPRSFLTVMKICH
jgi:hypothetical protein